MRFIVFLNTELHSSFETRRTGLGTPNSKIAFSGHWTLRFNVSSKLFHVNKLFMIHWTSNGISKVFFAYALVCFVPFVLQTLQPFIECFLIKMYSVRCWIDKTYLLSSEKCTEVRTSSFELDLLSSFIAGFDFALNSSSHLGSFISTCQPMTFILSWISSFMHCVLMFYPLNHRKNEKRCLFFSSSISLENVVSFHLVMNFVYKLKH